MIGQHSCQPFHWLSILSIINSFVGVNSGPLLQACLPDGAYHIVSGMHFATTTSGPIRRAAQSMEFGRMNHIKFINVLPQNPRMANENERALDLTTAVKW
jgi:hypothetical protein